MKLLDKAFGLQSRVSRAAQAPLLAEIPRQEASASRQPPGEVYLEAVRFLRCELQGILKPRASVRVIPTVPGLPTTHLAAFLAHSFAETGRSVALILLDGTPSPLGGVARWADRVTLTPPDQSSGQHGGPSSISVGFEYTVIASDVRAAGRDVPANGGAVLVHDPAAASLRQLREQAGDIRAHGIRVLGVALVKRR